MDEDERHINLHATPEMMAGVYANFANVSHSDYEFSITFVRLDHESEENGELNGVVVSRVNLSTRFMKELVEAMNDNYSKWLRRRTSRTCRRRPGTISRRSEREARAAGARPPSPAAGDAEGA